MTVLQEHPAYAETRLATRRALEPAVYELTLLAGAVPPEAWPAVRDEIASNPGGGK